MNLSALPTELVFEIRDFVYRPDWKTCKRAESALIRERIFYSKVVLCQNERLYGVVKEWTLMGWMWLAHALSEEGQELLDQDVQEDPPGPYDETNYNDPYEWYKMNARWFVAWG